MIKGIKTTLVAWEPEFWPFIDKWMSDPDYKFYFKNMPEVLNKTQLMNFPQLMNMNVLMIINNETRQCIGMATYDAIRMLARTCEIGFLVDKETQGKRIGKEAYMMFVSYLFERLGFYKVIARCAKEEVPTCEKGIKAGMKKEAEFEREFFLDGKYHDEIRFCCFADDFKKVYKEYTEGR